MFENERPRCREWTPLATQQLRLRSLIQIVGYNIRPPEGCIYQCCFYLTLHHTTMSAPFYTSEKISSPHPKWKEIDSELLQRMSSTNIVIRIWCHVLKPVSDEVDTFQDTVIQTWGVYFSGMRYLGANLALNFTSDCFKSNTLVFQMHGGYFCSYKSLKLDIIPPENEMEHGSLSSDSSGKTNISRVTSESKILHNHKFKDYRSISPSKFSKKSDREYSISNSPIERGFKQNFPTIRSASSQIIGQNHRDRYNREDSNERKKVDPNYIYEHSPDSMDVTHDVNGDISKNASREDLAGSKIDLSEIAENYDLRNESDGMPKYRYTSLSFLKSEIRPSYNATKLQKLHLLQYSIKKRQEAVQEIKERIYLKSALANNSWHQPDELDFKKLKQRSQKNLFSLNDDACDGHKSSSQNDLSVKNGRIKEDKPRVSNGPRLTLKLNDLLSFKSKPSPFQRAEHVRLTKHLEILRFKRIILSDERDSKLANIRRLKEIRAKMFEENQDMGSELMENYHTLSRRSDSVKESRQSCAALRELAARAHSSLSNLRCELMGSLHQIFYIQQVNESSWTIVDVPLPLCDDETPRHSNPVSDAVAAGYVAQATCIAAAVLNQPLRYRIQLLGSASKVLDFSPELPDPNIPLFARGGDTTLYLYAMFLLNKCIAQLLKGRGLPVTDMRTTLANLQRLLLTPCSLSDTSKLFGTYKWLEDSNCPRTQSLRSLVATDRGRYRQFNRFKDAVDGQSPQTAMNLRRHRHSRSVGSYNDDQDLSTLDASTTSIMGSEPNIYHMKLTKVSSAEIDSETVPNAEEAIQKAEDGTDKKVIFTLGDDTTLVGLTTSLENGARLVRISSNNEDLCQQGVDDNMRRICSEIESFCSASDHMNTTNAEEDVATDTDSGVKSIDLGCESCETKDACEIVCAKSVTDVIVIPSAEAILDVEPDFEDATS